MNPYGLELLGYKENEVINTISIENLIPEGKLEEFQKEIEYIKHGKDIQNYEREFITKKQKRLIYFVAIAN
ncbi:PAS domain-containing protein [Anaerobacillus sp. HL2]|nr:PAS domain-containing protein [Anaerobacillus sp. HL2]